MKMFENVTIINLCFKYSDLDNPESEVCLQTMTLRTENGKLFHCNHFIMYHLINKKFLYLNISHIVSVCL